MFWPSTYILHALDSTLCLLVFFPSMLFYWRGIWDLTGVYFLPHQTEPLRSFIMTAVGACALVSYATLPLLNRYLSRDKKLIYVTVTRLHMYVHGALVMLSWRGVWTLADYYLRPYGWPAALIGWLVGHVSLTLMMVSKSVIFTPFVVAMDTDDDILIASTCLESKFESGNTRSVLAYTLDSVLTQYIILPIVIVTWQSFFFILDLIIFPDDHLFSNAFSFGLGFVLSSLLFLLDSPLRKLTDIIEERYGSLVKTAWEDLVYLVTFFSMAFLWKGGWYLNAVYIIPDPLIGGWVNHVVGTVLLVALQLLSFVGGCGCCVDGGTRVKGGFYQTEYLRKLLAAQERKFSSESEKSEIVCI